jgi:hypothetical protein
MSRSIHVLTGLALLALAPFAPAEARAQASATAPSPELDALLDLLADGALLREVMFAGVDQEMGNLGATDPEMGKLFAEHPGLDKHLALRTKEVLGRLMDSGLPELRSRISALITSEMNPAQIAASARFFSTPSGRALYRLGAMKGMEAELKSKGSRADISQVEAMRQVRKEDIPALLAFGKSGASKVFEQLGPQMEAVSTQWGEALTKGHESELETAGAEAVLEFLTRDPEPKPAEDKSKT